MRTYVTTCPQNEQYLSEFFELANRFYPWEIEVDMAEPGESRSDQLIRLTSNLRDTGEEYFTLLEEDFFLVSEVDVSLLKEVCKFSRQYGVDRFSLQSKNHYSYRDWIVLDKTACGLPTYRPPANVAVLFSTEASVWRTEFLRDNLKAGWNDYEIETQVSRAIRSTLYNIIALDQVVLDYRDAMSRGKRIIRLAENPLRLTVESGDGFALFPWTGHPNTTTMLLEATDGH